LLLIPGLMAIASTIRTSCQTWDQWEGVLIPDSLTDPWSYRLVGSRAENNRYVVVMEDKTWDQFTTGNELVWK